MNGSKIEEGCINCAALSTTIPIHIHGGITNTIVEVKDGVVHVYPYSEADVSRLISEHELSLKENGTK